ncbi:MAG: hypothetical protein EHM39_02285 [Chloroflexi bacterium]|nr:MAG: hypothetical protein EHM39_02285 [Chloroflexota bacterium]
MSFEPKKFSDVFESMRAKAEAASVITDFETGSVARTLVESFSYEVALLYEKMQLVYLSAFVDTAEGQQLDMVVAILGITRSEPDFAEGIVTVQRDIGNEDIQIPFGTLVATEDTPEAPKKVYQTVEAKTLPKDQTSVDVRVQAFNRGEQEVVEPQTIVVMPRPIPGIKAVANANATIFTGKRRETDDELRERAKNALISSGKASIIAIENALLSMSGITDVRVIEPFDTEPPQYGVAQVYVDGVDLSVPTEAIRVRDAIDQVRAAGIFVMLETTVALAVESVFQIEINPDLKLSPEERAEFEANVQEQIESYIESLKMGDPLLLSQIIKSILAVDGVNDLIQFTMSITREKADGTTEPIAFDPATTRRVESEPSERFKARLLCVASEMKPLPVHIEFRASAGLDAATLDAARSALQAYFDGLDAGAPVVFAEVESRITGAGISLAASSLELAPQPWCGTLPATSADIAVRFVEKAALGAIFAYHSVLKITGALKLTLPATLTTAERLVVEAAVLAELTQYLADLPADADVVLDDLITLAESVSPVQRADLDPDDFRVRLNDDTTLLPGRVTDDKIEVQAFERAEFEHLCVTGSTPLVRIVITGLTVEVLVPAPAPTGSAATTLQNNIKNGIAGKPLLAGLEAGEAVTFDAASDAIESLIPGTNYRVTAMTLTGESECDDRIQTASSPGSSIHVRSVEIASVQPVETAAITVTITGV